MKKKNPYIITIIGLGLAILIGLSLTKLNFIPILNNSLIIIEFFLLALVFINIGYLIGKIPLKKKCLWVLRIIFLALYYGALGLGLFYYIIFSLFAFMDNNKVKYQGETYYYMDQGFIDPNYVFYKKTGLTMEQCGSGYEYLPQLNEENLKKLIEGTYRENPENPSLESEELGI
ncbi:MAG: hypothetical protein Q4E36_02840 [Bacillota bacterium]|nr:hypothetical protein [Bacillota bacterium]